MDSWPDSNPCWAFWYIFIIPAVIIIGIFVSAALLTSCNQKTYNEVEDNNIDNSSNNIEQVAVNFAIPKTFKLVVQGIYRTGKDYEGNLIFTSLKTAQKVLWIRHMILSIWICHKFDKTAWYFKTPIPIHSCFFIIPTSSPWLVCWHHISFIIGIKKY